MATEEREPGTESSAIVASAPETTSRTTSYLTVIKDKIKNTLTKPGKRTTIPGIITNNKTTLKNLVISLAVLGLEYLLQSELFKCPEENHQVYGRFWLYGPPAIIFLVNLLIIGNIWQLTDRCLVYDYYRIGYFCGHTFPSIVEALVGAAVWLTVAFFRMEYYVCGEVGPDIRQKNVTDPERLKEYDLAVETAGAESQIYAWAVFLVMMFLATVVIISKKCIFKDQGILDDIRVFEEREAKWAKKTFNEFAQGLRMRNDELNESATQDPEHNAKPTVVKKGISSVKTENLEETSHDPELTEGKAGDDSKEESDGDEEVKIPLYPDGIPEKFGEKMVIEMFKGWRERNPNWHYSHAYEEFRRLYPRAATGDPTTRWSTTYLSKQFPIRKSPWSRSKTRLPDTQPDYGSTELKGIAPKRKSEIDPGQPRETTALISP